jgi:hypothetical protein
VDGSAADAIATSCVVGFDGFLVVSSVQSSSVGDNSLESALLLVIRVLHDEAVTNVDDAEEVIEVDADNGGLIDL